GARVARAYRWRTAVDRCPKLRVAGSAAGDNICLAPSVLDRSTCAHPEVSGVCRNRLGPSVPDYHIRVLGTDTVRCWKAHISRQLSEYNAENASAIPVLRSDGIP